MKTKTMATVGLITALLCILGPQSISIAVSPVPISLGVFGVLIACYALGMKKSVLSVIIYILLGLVGLPVFSNFSGGPAKLFGPTGGYIIGYIPLAILGGFFIDKFEEKIYMHVIGFVLGVISCYLLGTAWLSFQAHMTFWAALDAGVIPFIPADIVKIIIAIIAGVPIRTGLRKAQLF